MQTFTPDNIRLTGSAATKDQALALVADFAAERGYTADSAGVLEGLHAREAQLSTAMMDGIAIPHAKHAAVIAPALLVLRLDAPVDWTDDQVTVLVAMLVPEEEGGTTHLHLLAQVSRALIEDEVRAVLATGDAADVHRVLSDRIE